jgi:CheY-like chemotaxis protein
VLLVEDEPEVRKVIRQQLTELGFPVLEAANGLEAQAMLEAVDDIALLVSDTVMPGLGGRELAAFARSLRPALPILLITGYATGDAPPAPRHPDPAQTLRPGRPRRPRRLAPFAPGAPAP